MQRHGSYIDFKALQCRGNTSGNGAIKSRAGSVQPPVNVVHCPFQISLCLSVAWLFPCRLLLHLPGPFSSHHWPRNRRCRSKEKQVRSSGHSQCFTEFHCTGQTTEFCQKVQSAFYASCLQSVFTDAFEATPCCFTNITVFHEFRILPSEMENRCCTFTCCHVT